ncbi:hypothetical protein D9M68_101650 [compost metagenome]
MKTEAPRVVTRKCRPARPNGEAEKYRTASVRSRGRPGHIEAIASIQGPSARASPTVSVSQAKPASGPMTR